MLAVVKLTNPETRSRMQTVQYALLFMRELVCSAKSPPLMKRKATVPLGGTFSICSTHRYYVRGKSKTVTKPVLLKMLLTANFFQYHHLHKEAFDWVKGNFPSAFY